MGRSCILFDLHRRGRSGSDGIGRPWRESADPRDDTPAGQNGPTVSFPSTDALLVQQAFQLMRLAMSQWLEGVSWAPVPQHERAAKSFVIQNRSVAVSLLSLLRPVNLREAKSACQARHCDRRFSLQIDWVLKLFPPRFRAPIRRPCVVSR